MIELSDRSVRSLLAKVFFLSFQFFSVRILLSWTKRTHASTSKAACIRMIDFSAAPVLLSTYHCVTVRRASPHNWRTTPLRNQQMHSADRQRMALLMGPRSTWTYIDQPDRLSTVYRLLGPGYLRLRRE